MESRRPVGGNVHSAAAAKMAALPGDNGKAAVSAAVLANPESDDSRRIRKPARIPNQAASRRPNPESRCMAARLAPRIRIRFSGLLRNSGAAIKMAAGCDKTLSAT